MVNYTFSSTDSTIIVNISNMITDGYLIQKRFTFYIDKDLDGQYDDPESPIIAYCTDGTYQHIYTGLQQDTEYLIGIQIEYLDSGIWQLQDVYETSQKTTGEEIQDNPYFTAEIYSNNNIHVEIFNLLHYDRTYFYLWDHNDYNHLNPIAQSPENYVAPYYDFQNLDSGQYDISVEYLYEGYYDSLYTQNGDQYIPISISTGYPTYTYGKSGNSITLNAQNKGAYLLNYIVRLDSDPNDQSHTLYRTNNTSYTADNLQWNTDYRVNVGYSTVEDPYYITWISDPGPLVQIGAQPSGDDGYVYIYDGTNWQKAIPYIYDGTNWQKAIPYIFNGTEWKKCIE